MAESSVDGELRELHADDMHKGWRLDHFLAKALPELSRARLQALIKEGRVRKGEATIGDPNFRVKPGESYAVSVPPPLRAEPQPQAIPLTILYEDDDLIVIDKQAGLVVHPAAGNLDGTLVNALLAHCGASLKGIGGVARPGIVHRLDKDVSGLMVVAKRDLAHVGLAAQFSVHRIERAYDAIVWGVPPAVAGSIEAPIGRHPKDRKRMAVVEGGKRALTHYRLEESAGTLACRLRLALATGRTHQIRVHLASMGLGIVGDPVYRPRRRPAIGPALRREIDDFGRLALHARVLGFEHPTSGERLRFERPPPAAFAALFARLQLETGSFIPR